MGNCSCALLHAEQKTLGLVCPLQLYIDIVADCVCNSCNGLGNVSSCGNWCDLPDSICVSRKCVCALVVGPELDGSVI